MKSLFSIFLITAMFSTFLAQDASPNEDSGVRTNQWRGAILDKSTEKDVIKLFGEPTKLKSNQKLLRTIIDKKLTKRIDEKIFKDLRYKKKLKGFKDARFVFTENKLVMIYLVPKEAVRPNSVVNAYDSGFKPYFHSFMVGFSRKQDFGRDGNGNLYAKSYPSAYHLLSTTENSFIVVGVSNGSFGSILGKAVGLESDSLVYPGKVHLINLISKTLEDNEADDLLK